MTNRSTSDIAWIVALAALAGCAAPPAPTSGPDAGASDASVDAARSDVLDANAAADVSVAADAPSAACVALHARLETALAEGFAASRSRAAWMAAVTADCGPWAGAVAVESEPEVRPDQLLRIGSVTKTFVSAVVLQLADEGRLGLDDPIARWVDGVPGGENITLRQLLNHTSGLFNYTEDPRFFRALSADPRHVFTPRELLGFALDRAPYFAPGAGWHYSNTGYVLLGLAVERAASTTVSAAVRARLVGPAGLTRTYFDGAERVPGAELAPGFTANGVEVTDAHDPSRAWAAGAMVGTVGDMAAWAARLYGGDVLSPAARAAQLMTVATGPQAGVRYGLGVFEFAPSVAITRAVGHGGDIEGYHVDMLYLPERRAAFAVAVNTDGASRNALSVAALRVLARP